MTIPTILESGARTRILDAGDIQAVSLKKMLDLINDEGEILDPTSFIEDYSGDMTEEEIEQMLSEDTTQVDSIEEIEGYDDLTEEEKEFLRQLFQEGGDSNP
jgi:hypothetical protein